MPFHLLPPESGRPAPAPASGSSRLSRRDFLTGLALIGAGVGMGTGCSSRAGSRGNPGGWVAWVSDPHIAADPAAGLHGQIMADNLRAVVADILDADDPPHGVFFDGDLAFHDGQPGDYQTFLNLVEPLRQAGLPLHLGLGNHDDRTHFRSAIGELMPTAASVGEKHVGIVEGPHLRTLILDSLQQPNVTGGLLGEPQLAWLADQLDAHPETPTAIFVHHNLNAEWAAALHDTTPLLDLLHPRRQAKLVVFGHTHVFNVQPLDGLVCINLPAVGYKFLRKQPLGYCVFRPSPDGGELELRCVGGDRRKDRRRLPLQWRPA